MVFFVNGDLTPVMKWLKDHGASKVEERFSRTELNIEVDDDDEESFVDLCESNGIECRLA
jgi:hypothetical protein